MTVDRTALPMGVDVLGPLLLTVGGAAVPVPGSRRRALLVVLALAGGRVVGTDRLVDTLWPDEPPDNAVQALYSHVSRLRGHLGPVADRLERSAGGPDASPELVGHAWAARGAVAHFRGDFRAARDGWSRAAEHCPAIRAALLASAAMAAAYGGEVAESRRLLDLAHADAARSGGVSQAALAAYVEGELLATDSIEEAVPYYTQAIEAAGRAGAVFIEGVARVAAASAHARTGNVREAAAEFVRVLDEWRRTGQPTQLWTTSRNAAELLSKVGLPRVAALLVLTADEQPGAAAVSPAIARRTGRAFVPVEELVDAAEVEALREEAHRLGPSGVLDLGRGHLVELAGSAREA